MRILQVVSSFPPAYAYGGAAKVAYELSKSLVNRGHEVTVYTTDVLDGQRRYTNTCSNVQIDGIEVCRFKNISNRIAYNLSISCAPNLISAIKSNIQNYDIVHSHEYRSIEAIAIYRYAKKYNIPYIIQAHGQLPTETGKGQMKRGFDKVTGNKIINSASGLIAVSKPEIDQYLKMGVEFETIELLPNGLRIKDYKNISHHYFRKKYNIQDDIKIILYIGRIHKRKGIQNLISAFSNLLKEINNVILILGGPDGGYQRNLTSQIISLGIDDKVIFTGQIDENEKNALYADGDVLVYPSLKEIFGLVPFEAIMCGTPVIVTDDCGCGDIIKEAKCGLTILHGDIEELTNCLKIFLNCPERSQEYVIRGKNYIIENMDWDKIAIRLEEIYKNVHIKNSFHEGEIL